MSTMTAKTCCKCRVDKSLDDFYKAPKQPFGRNSWCKECFKSHQAAYRAANKEKIRVAQAASRIKDPAKHRLLARKHFLRKKFGLSLEEYDAKYAAQDGRCAICKRHQSELTRAMAVDHDHATGAIRDLLCGNCNAGVGQFREDPELLEAAINYPLRFEVP